MTSWQDMVLTIANICFSYALIPQIYQGFKNKKGFVTFQTSLITFIGLFAISITFLNLKLYFSTITAMTSSLLWYILLLQRVVYGSE